MLKKWISLVICAAMIVGLLPQVVFAENKTDGTCQIGKTIYQLVNAPANGGEYLIVTGNSAGEQGTLSRNGNSLTNYTVMVNVSGASTYVSNIGEATVWTATGSNNSWTFTSGDGKLSGGSNNLTTNTSGTAMSYTNNSLSWRIRSGIRYNTYYANWNGSSWVRDSYNATEVYFYQKNTSDDEFDTYSLSANNVQMTIGTPLSVNDIAKQLKLNGNNLTTELGGTYSYEIRPGSDVISLSDGTLTPVTSGSATVRVKYTWDGNEVWTDFTVTVGEPHYDLEIREGDTSKNIIAKKNVKADDTLELNAVVLYGNSVIPSPTVIWSSTKEDIATVDSNGKVTFTGTEGTTVILATYTYTYKDENNVEHEKTVIDQVTVTASQGNLIFPADGTNDFPEYPNEGSIRFDKTAVAVGDFNTTGITQVELSMTGVPYATGVDVIVMLDMSSSMTRCIYCGQKENGCNCSTFKSREDELSAAMQELQNILQSSDNAANIRIAVADFNGTQNFGPTQYDSNDHTEDVGTLTNAGNQKVYTGPNSGKQVDNSNRRSLLSATAFIPVSELNVSTFNYAPSTGTNYDYGFDAVYQLGHAIKQQNIADNDPDRKLFVIFMSDGASNQFNYYNTTGGQDGNAGTSDWDKWLTGSIDGSTYTFSDIISCQTHSYYYDAATGNQHRMANAIKGDPNRKYEVIRKNQNLNQDANQGGNDAVTDVLESTGRENLYMIPGLGATTYTIAFYVINDGNISAESAKHSLRATASSAGHYVEAEQEGAIGNAFKNIAGQIVEAAKDVVVTDQMGDQYTMIFEAPNRASESGASGQEYYIEILDYTLDSTTHERIGNGTSLMKLYMGSSTTNNVTTYFAASDAKGTAYASPVFEAKPFGSIYYWTTENITESATYSGVSVEVNDVTYYFDYRGKKETENKTAPANWYNMTSGAYASGTVTTVNHPDVAGDAEDTNYCKDLIIATPYFVYNANEFNKKDKMLYWTLEKISRNETVMRYFLYLDNSGGYHGTIDQDPDSYPTNEGAELTYTNFQDNLVQQEFPEPQMTWHGAQVSYVFYLVNEQGQPVNRAGRVVPLSEAVYVTDVHTISVVWSGLEEQDKLSSALLAQDIVPSVYELYDPTATYTIHAFANEDKMLQNNHFKIEGDASVNTTYVFNSKSDTTKYSLPGVYGAGSKIMCKDYDVTKEGDTWTYNGDSKNQYKKEDGSYVYGTDANGRHYTIAYETADRTVEDGFNFYDTTVAFAVKWIPSLAPDEVVIDYGLDVMIDITTNDMGVPEPVGLMAAAPEGVLINTGVIPNFDPSTTERELSIKDANNVTVATASLEGNSIRFHLNRENSMTLNKDYTFYYVSKLSYYSNDTLEVDYMYTSVRVIPATTMYYEEDFVPSISGWESTGSMSATAVQDVDRPGFNNISATNDANNVYGFDSHYRNCPSFSHNAAKIGKDKDVATFTFNGTGFDLIGRTDNETACILVSLTKDGTPVSFTGSFTQENQTVTVTGESIFVDTYYEGADGASAIPQVPVITVRDLDYGTYTVTVEVVRAEEADTKFYHENAVKFYFDAVRIYNPTGIRSYTDEIGKVYVEDNEWKPGYEEFRNEILQVYGNAPFSNVTFIDRLGTAVEELSVYDTWGPNNEFYLAPEESIVLTIDGTYLQALLSQATNDNTGYSRGMADMQLGIKLVSGSNAALTISSNNGLSRQYNITSTSDLNFSIKDLYAGTLTIKNNGGGIVALTTMKVTLQPPLTTAVFAMRRNMNVGIEEQPGYIENNTNTENSTNTPAEVPESPHGIISDAILDFKESFAAVIIAVANAMDGFSKWLQDVANALFS